MGHLARCVAKCERVGYELASQALKPLTYRLIQAICRPRLSIRNDRAATRSGFDDSVANQVCIRPANRVGRQIELSS